MKARLLLVPLLLAIAPLAHAGPFTDTLSTCLVKKTTEKERTVLVRWIFAAASHHPDVKDLVAVSKDEEERLSKSMAELFMVLMTERCVSETSDAMRYEGSAAIEAGFSTLGQIAGAGLMSHPAVAEFTGRMAQYLDQEKLDKLKQVTEPAPAAKP